MPATSQQRAPGFSQKNSRVKLRAFKDRSTAWAMGIGGISVIIAIVLIFFYLLYIVFPLFVSAEIHAVNSYPIPGNQYGKTLHIAVEEQNKVALRITQTGKAVFFNVTNGDIKEIVPLILPKSTTITSFNFAKLSDDTFVLGLSNGQVVVAKHFYDISYPNDELLISPKIKYPLGEDPLQLDPEHHPITLVTYQQNDERSTVIGWTDDDRLIMQVLQKDESGLADDDEDNTGTFTTEKFLLPKIKNITHLLLDTQQKILFVAQMSGEITVIDISSPDNPKIREVVRVVKPDANISSIQFLTGGISLLIGDNHGHLSQWFSVTRNNNTRLTLIREFTVQQGKISAIVTEQRRKGFVSVTSQGIVSIFNTTAHREVISQPLSTTPIDHAALSPRANLLLTESGNKISSWSIKNEHPEISWSVLWKKVWYESYSEPSYTWQSSSADNDFEPKYSLVPLAFGTLKAAFYAMLFAIPLALMGAIYTAYFMAPKMRTVVKPTIEIMEALPTVILGFLAGLWLAPFLEANLPGVFALLIILPLGILIFAFSWQKLPREIRIRVPDGWHAALLIPVILLLGFVSIKLSQPLELWLFAGNMRGWLDTSLGLEFDQRNSLVVGIAMGVAVIPTIFSIAEDAIYSVPKHLTFGSLALGATTWQTLIRVVILTASPGIFSAIMIGLGRAVGETMIVLMATGNTPVMDLSIFQGMRTLAANISVEIPEAEVDSTHFRILFLAALVLFIVTFMFNTGAEIIRQHLRKKYSSL